MKIKAVLLLVTLLVCAGAQGQQTENPPQPATASPSSKTDELLKTLSSDDRAALLKRLQEPTPQQAAPQVDRTPSTPPPAPNPTPQPAPQANKNPNACEAAKTVSKVARVAGAATWPLRLKIIQMTGIDAVGGGAAAATTTPCKPAAPATDPQAGK